VVQISESDFKGTSRSDTLVVAFHGFDGSPDQYGSIIDNVFQDVFSEADFYIPTLPFSSWFATVRMHAIVDDQVAALDQLNARRIENVGVGYERIVILGYSGGSLLARAVLLRAWGLGEPRELYDDHDSPTIRAWSERVGRIVLLAGMNRGWNQDTPLGVSRRISLWFANLLLLFWFARAPTILDIRRGSPFLTALRLNWLAAKRSGRHMPLVVQLLGTLDDLVNPMDNIDLATGEDFQYLEVPGSGHLSVLNVQPKREFLGEIDLGEVRGQKIRLALTGTAEEIIQSPHNVSADWLAAERRDIDEDPSIDHVIFIIHGIRDFGFWSHKIGRQIRRLAGQQSAHSPQSASQDVEIINSSYGYFPILPFLLPSIRQEKVEWLLDKYVEAKRRFPNATKISYIGHSNGTYLLARALEICPKIDFYRVLFAGSVVRRKYRWGQYLDERVAGVLNLVATGDWVVAVVPKGVQPFRMFDLGSAGHDGFSDKAVDQIRYINGGHSAGIRETLWDDAADYVLTGKVPAVAIGPEISKRRTLVTLLLGWFATPLVLAILFVAIAIAWFLGTAIMASPIPPELAAFAPWAWLSSQTNLAWLATLIYAWIVWLILTRF
jgi:Alpha/beta hydrolase family